MGKKVQIAAVGDIGLIGRVAEDILEGVAKNPFASVKSVFDGVDLVFGNLEIPFTEPWMQPRFKEIPPRLRSLPKCVYALSEAGFNIVSLANNHIMDYGIEGLELTQRLLKEKKIKYVGAGRDIGEARQPVVFERRGMRIGFLAYAQQGNHSAWIGRPGATPIRRELIIEDLTALRKMVDYVVVSLHFGMIYCDYPNPEDQDLARWIIDQGAHVIVGHHPHVLQGIEKYNGGVIAYSLGEFIFDPTLGNVLATTAKEVRRQSFVAVIFLNEDTIGINPIPVLIGEDYRPTLCSIEMKKLILERLDNISGVLLRDDFAFSKYVALRSVEHNAKVLWFHLRNMNLGYLLRRLKKVKLFHLKMVFNYIRSSFSGTSDRRIR